MSYTPGPWKAGPWSNGRQWVYGGPDGDRPICEVRGNVDARLIAAAPELLAALQTLLDDIDKDVSDEAPSFDIWPENDPHLNAARALLDRLSDE